MFRDVLRDPASYNCSLRQSVFINNFKVTTYFYAQYRLAGFKKLHDSLIIIDLKEKRYDFQKKGNFDIC